MKKRLIAYLKREFGDNGLEGRLYINYCHNIMSRAGVPRSFNGSRLGLRKRIEVLKSFDIQRG
jgi:hypothetical protein